MALDIDKLVQALPVEDQEETSPRQALQQLIGNLSGKPVPTGALHRLWVLGTLQSKVAAAYLVHWIRAGFKGEDEKERLRNETRLKAALKVLGGMSYLRGAIMKLGQLFATYPDVLPDEFADVLGRLHFEAPPMHMSLLRELFRREIGADPEDVFTDFETEAFAAASLGQVHRARLRDSGEPVAVKIQYPNIARTIRDDFRNMRAILLPMRLRPDWDNFKEQFEDVRRKLDEEVDYQNEACNLDLAAGAFDEQEGVVVPRVHREFSSRRVLTMDHLEGVHLAEYLARRPPQEERDRYGHLIVLSSMRLSYGRHLLHADPHPGNYFFMPDRRLGLIDFGCCSRYTDADVDYMALCERAIEGPEETVRDALAMAGDLTPRQAADPGRFDLMKEWCDWVWEPLRHEGLFDFGDPTYFRRGMKLYGDLLKRRYTRSLPLNTWFTRCFVGIRAILARLEARVDFRGIWMQESSFV